MADYNAIADISKSLLEILREEITAREDVISLDPTDIILGSPNDVSSDSDTRLSLYLYKVDKSGHQYRQTVDDEGIQQAPPLSLNLHYLLTAYPSNSSANEMTNMSDQHNALGLAMQVFHDNATLETESMDEQTDESRQLSISMEAEAENKISRIWDSFQDVPLYPSVTYQVGPVLIESRRREQVHRVREREVEAEQKKPPTERETADQPEVTRRTPKSEQPDMEDEGFTWKEK